MLLFLAKFGTKLFIALYYLFDFLYLHIYIAKSQISRCRGAALPISFVSLSETRAKYRADPVR